MVAPGLEDTLFSVSDFDKIGYATVYVNGTVTIYDNNSLSNDNTNIIASF